MSRRSEVGAIIERATAGVPGAVWRFSEVSGVPDAFDILIDSPAASLLLTGVESYPLVRVTVSGEFARGNYELGDFEVAELEPTVGAVVRGRFTVRGRWLFRTVEVHI
jgi:hypothetical protein